MRRLGCEATVSLDYIARFEQASAETLVDRIEAIVQETGQTGFHFVDEAAPPSGLRALAAELRRRNVDISWWGNVRFEKSFSPELCQQLADSGCIAISGGLEVASDRRMRAEMSTSVSPRSCPRRTMRRSSSTSRSAPCTSAGSPLSVISFPRT